MSILSRVVALFLALSSTAAWAAEITGAGSVFIAPLFSAWGTSYSQHVRKTSIKYEASNASEGIRRISGKSVDFGQTDMPLSIDELKQKGLFQFPATLVAFTPIINIPGVSSGQLRLDGKTLGDIFMGKITKWNDPAIVAMNREIKLPNEAIKVAYRKLGASGTYVLSSYIARHNPAWKDTVGVGLTVAWRTGHPMETIKDMAKFIKDNPYSIGYTEFSHVIKNGLKYVQLQNRDGQFVKPSPRSVSAAARTAEWDVAKGFYIDLSDVAGAESWPMTSASYILIRKVADNPEHSKELLDYFNWGLRVGDLAAVQGDFIPLPASVCNTVRAGWKGIVDSNGAPIWP